MKAAEHSRFEKEMRVVRHTSIKKNGFVISKKEKAVERRGNVGIQARI